MFCSKCGSQVADSAAFCPTCGNATGGQGGAPRGIPVAPGAYPRQAMTARPAYESPAGQAPVYAQPAGQQVRWAGFWLRVVAYIIDYIILNIALSFVTLPMMAHMGLEQWMGHPPQSPAQIAAFFATFAKIGILAFFVNWLYFSLMESSAWQATVGKKTLGLEVTDLAGHRISFARATGRYFGKIISAIIFCIGFIMAGFTEKKQALHDMMAGTLVIRKI